MLAVSDIVVGRTVVVVYRQLFLLGGTGGMAQLLGGLFVGRLVRRRRPHLIRTELS